MPRMRWHQINFIVNIMNTLFSSNTSEGELGLSRLESEARLRWWGHVEYGDAKHGERWKIADDFHGCGEGGHEVR